VTLKISPLNKRRRGNRGPFDDACNFCVVDDHQKCEDMKFFLCGCWKDKHEEDFENPPGAATERRRAYAVSTKQAWVPPTAKTRKVAKR
jgi:hypothetical protein